MNRCFKDILEEELVSEEEIDENGEDESDEERGILDGFLIELGQWSGYYMVFERIGSILNN